MKRLSAKRSFEKRSPKKPLDIKIGVIAPSSMIPKVEFQIGVHFLESKGYSVKTHPTVFQNHLLYSATDEARAKAFLEYAFDKDLNILWCARGGYGATHLLPYLERATLKKKPPFKALFGYSDATALLEFTRTHWGWKTFHSPMPSFRSFSVLPKHEWALLEQSIQKCFPSYSYSLKPLHLEPSFKNTKAPLVGGNLAVWNSLVGTPYEGKAENCFLLLEEIGENIGRINRMLHQLEQSGGLKKVKALLLGDFVDCNDTAPLALKSSSLMHSSLTSDFLASPPSKSLAPIRKTLPSQKALDLIFKEFGQRFKLSIFKGLPVGHGKHQAALELGRTYSLTKTGDFS